MPDPCCSLLGISTLDVLISSFFLSHYGQKPDVINKPEGHNISQRRQRRTEPRPQVTGIGDLVNFGHAVPEITRSGQTGKHADRNTPCGYYRYGALTCKQYKRILRVQVDRGSDREAEQAARATHSRVRPARWTRQRTSSDRTPRDEQHTRLLGRRRQPRRVRAHPAPVR